MKLASTTHAVAREQSILKGVRYVKEVAFV